MHVHSVSQEEFSRRFSKLCQLNRGKVAHVMCSIEQITWPFFSIIGWHVCPTVRGQTARHQESNVVHFSRKMWHLVAIISIIFLIINWPNFVYLGLLVDPGFLFPLKFLWSITLHSPHKRPWQIQRTNRRVRYMKFDRSGLARLPN